MMYNVQWRSKVVTLLNPDLFLFFLEIKAGNKASPYLNAVLPTQISNN